LPFSLLEKLSGGKIVDVCDIQKLTDIQEE